MAYGSYLCVNNNNNYYGEVGHFDIHVEFYDMNALFFFDA
jgi:hypothetical protein